MRKAVFIACVLSLATLASAEDKTLTGWFADQSCATSRAKNGVYTPTNPDCAMKCIEKGDNMVLISEKDKAVYVVANPELGKDHFAEHVQVVGAVSSDGKLRMASVKDLGDYVGPACLRKKK